MDTAPLHTVLLVDDNPDDCEIVREAWVESPAGQELRFVHDGTELLDYLYRRAPFTDRASYPRPSLILLDLNMPQLSGVEVLSEIKKDPALASIPIVVLTTSKAPKDIVQTADLKVNGFIQKPNTYSGYLKVLSNLRKNWIEILTQPLSGSDDYLSGDVAWC